MLFQWESIWKFNKSGGNYMLKKVVTIFAIIGVLLAYTSISIGATQSDID